MTVLCIFFVKVKPTYDTQLTIEKRGYIIKFDYTEALLYRRTRLQADTPPGDTPPADGQVKLGPLPPEDTPPEDKPPGDIPPVDKPPEDEPPGGHPSRPPGGQASSLKNCYVQIKGAT